MNAEQLVFSRRHVVTLDKGPPSGDGQVAARQFDAVLMSIGFKCSEPLLTALSNLHPDYVIDVAVRVIGFARQEVGADKQHNVYFIDFPANVPDTLEFWNGLIRDAVREYAATGESSVRAGLDPRGQFVVDLLSLPGYGTYQHTYQEMLEHHAEFEPLLADRMTLLHLGRDIETEARLLFADLAGSAVPLNEADLAAVRFLAPSYSTPFAVGAIPVRETLAVVNAERVRSGLPLVAPTVTDVLRCAAELAGADVSLAKPPKFTSFSRRIRRELVSALDLAAGAHALPDMLRHPEAWKRLAERLHPHEFPVWENAQLALKVARGETDVLSRAGQVEQAFAAGRPDHAAHRMSPGEFYRSLDRLLRYPAGPEQKLAVVRQAEHCAPDVSGRVLLSVREHLMNRVRPGGPRVFVGRKGRAWVTADKRDVLDTELVRDLNGVIDAAIMSRLPGDGLVLVDPAVLGAALPLSGRAQAEGLGSWPRGSTSRLEDGEWLRMFAYWRQASSRTDYDLSCLFAGPAGQGGWLSYTNLSNQFGEHSGDITDATNGASEFVNIRLAAVPHGMFIVPQLYVFSGEGFDEVAENFVGYMTRSADQRGLPFEARTVRMKTVLRGEDKVAMPVVFFRGDDGAWYAKWLNLGLKGAASLWGGAKAGGFRVEENRMSTQLLVDGIMARQYLTLRYLADAYRACGCTVIRQDKAWRELLQDDDKLTYIGIEQPEGLPAGSEVFTLGRLGGLIPA